jgi:phosphoglycolate phosphatase-like HAD superfamily hydrolase
MLVFCDLDGTLLDPAPRHYRVYSEVTRELGGEPLPQPEYWDLKRQKTKWAVLLPLSRLGAEQEPEFLKLFIEKIEDPAYLDMDPLLPGAELALRYLEEKGATVYLVSLRRQQERLHAQLVRLGVAKYFKEILSGHSEGDGVDVKQPLITAKLNGSTDAVMIGDTETDIKTGKALGIRTIGVYSGLRTESLIRALHPDYVLPGIGDLPNVL